MRKAGLSSVAILVTLWIANALISWRTPIWSPRDEIAHFDYVDRLADGERPRPDDPISERTFTLTTREFAWSAPPQFDGSRRSMGLAAYSYEARQPPLYYAILAGPHRWLRDRLTPRTEVGLLRLLSLCLVASSAFVVAGAGAGSAAFGDGFRELCLLVAVALSSFQVTTYLSLGNDSLSALAGAVAFRLIAGALASPSAGRLIGLAAVIASAAVLVKPTNAALVVLLPAAVVALARKSSWRRVVAPLAVAVALCALAAAALAVDELASPRSSGDRRLERKFTRIVAPTSGPSELGKALVSSAFDLSHLGLRESALAFGLGAVALGVGAFAAIRSRRSLTPPARTLALVAGVTVVVTFAAAAAANRLLPGIHWQAARQYAAAMPFWYLLAGLPLLVWRRAQRHASKLAAIWAVVSLALAIAGDR